MPFFTMLSASEVLITSANKRGGKEGEEWLWLFFFNEFVKVNHPPHEATTGFLECENAGCSSL